MCTCLTLKHISSKLAHRSYLFLPNYHPPCTTDRLTYPDELIMTAELNLYELIWMIHKVNAWWWFGGLVLLQMQGVHYFIRVSAYNVKGWGPPLCSTPASAAPSSEYTELQTLMTRLTLFKKLHSLSLHPWVMKLPGWHQAWCERGRIHSPLLVD